MTSLIYALVTGKQTTALSILTTVILEMIIALSVLNEI